MDGKQSILPQARIQEDILNVDCYCDDNSVDVFKLSHTYEHIPIVKLEDFAKKLPRKLKKDGKLIIIHTDIKKTLELYRKRKIDFYCLRDIIFSPIDRSKASFNVTGRDLYRHQFMWGADELKKELLYYGFSKVQIVNAGAWDFDVNSVFPFQKNEDYFRVKIPNLGVIAYK